MRTPEQSVLLLRKESISTIRDRFPRQVLPDALAFFLIARAIGKVTWLHNIPLTTEIILKSVLSCVLALAASVLLQLLWGKGKRAWKGKNEKNDQKIHPADAVRRPAAFRLREEQSFLR